MYLLLQYCLACSLIVGCFAQSCSNKHPNTEECDKWAAEGECQINQAWMPDNCRKSCRLCVECENIHNTLECDNWALSNECSLNPNWMIPNCRKSCKKCAGDGGGGDRACNDNNQLCGVWARAGECQINPGYMLRSCKKTCFIC
ncbi:putative tyrosinase-like protein tyr-3 [Dreissena polymorpha]|uniref:ShKT domain-containing protein n=1 Tax=Dreissena polymorpha TaxID=45954 RepID=A0A9D4QUX8_DREPO|nr:putative tyrosinase-like protein tyr-3 [Dreissena polymorpha]KAH3844576.1 hypothetical protein DPMN_086835 [Dreissena polymorpha]